MRFSVDTTCFSQEPGMKGKENRWKHAASVAYSSITSTGVCLWQTLNRAGRLTGRQIYNIHKVQPLRRHQRLNCTFYGCQRNLRREKKTKKSQKINSKGKINSWCIFSLLGNTKHCNLFNLTVLMSQTRAGSCRRRHNARWPKRRRRERVSYSWRKRCRRSFSSASI